MQTSFVVGPWATEDPFPHTGSVAFHFLLGEIPMKRSVVVRRRILSASCSGARESSDLTAIDERYLGRSLPILEIDMRLMKQ